MALAWAAVEEDCPVSTRRRKIKKLTSLFIFVVVLVLVGFGCESKPLGDSWTRCADGRLWSTCQKGEFEMGSTGGPERERPVHGLNWTVSG